MTAARPGMYVAVLAVALVVIRCPPHLALDHDDELFADFQFAGATDEIGDAHITGTEPS